MARKTKTNPETKRRVRKSPAYKSFRLSKKIKPAAAKPLPGIIALCRLAMLPMKKNKKLFLGIIALYLLLSLVFLGGISFSLSFLEVKNNLEETFGNNLSGFSSTLTMLTYILSSGTGAQGGSSGFQAFIALLTSLAIIWGIRQVLAGDSVTVRQTFYQGIYPLVPFLLILFVIGLQLIPFLIGNFLLSTILANELAVTFAEKMLWWLVFGLLALLSLYMVTSSIFALYISTLPNMMPMKALRSARGLVLHRRLPIVFRLIGLPIIVAIIYFVILTPLIFIVPILAVPAFLFLSSFSLYFVHSYIYNLYRSLL